MKGTWVENVYVTFFHENNPKLRNRYKWAEKEETHRETRRYT
jgi:hypothetical protein